MDILAYAFILRCERCGTLLRVAWNTQDKPEETTLTLCPCGLAFTIADLAVRWYQPWVCGRCCVEIPVGVLHDYGACPPAPPGLYAQLHH
jgi:hypothetical protein